MWYGPFCFMILCILYVSLKLLHMTLRLCAMLFHNIQQFEFSCVIHFANILVDVCTFTFTLLTCHILARLAWSGHAFYSSDGVSPYTNKNIFIKTNAITLLTCTFEKNIVKRQPHLIKWSTTPVTKNSKELGVAAGWAQ
jgi:hypothetical protein